MLAKIINKYFDIPSNFYTFENRYLVIASFFGCGYFKKAPGTFTSFITLLIVLILGTISNSLVIIFATLIIIIGLFVSSKISTVDNPDPSYVVIDEVAGQSIALILVSSNIILSILAFIIFRILDIKKPWIIGSSEKMFSGGTAIMIDDIIAGFLTLLIVNVVSVIFF